MLVSGYPHSLSIEDHYFALSVEGLKNGFVWQLLTYQFMHAGVLHIAVQLLGDLRFWPCH